MEIGPCDITKPIPEAAFCQEASPLSTTEYIPCADPAAAIVYSDKDGRGYYMCLGCADHNVKNRGGRLILRLESPPPYVIPASELMPEYITPKTKVVGDPESGSEAEQLAILLKEQKEAAEDFEDKAKEKWKEYTETERKLVGVMTASGFDLFRISGLGTFSTDPKNHPSVTQANQEAFNTWLDENGMGAMAKRTVHPSTLKGWANNWLKEGKDLPPMVGNWPTVGIRITKPSKK